MKGLSIITAFVFSFFSFSCYGNADSHPQATLGEINEAPLKEIKQIIRRAYKAYKKGHPDLPKNYSVMAGYNIANDGSLSEIRLIKSSGSIMVDRTTAEILFNIGESRLFGIVSDQTSNSASLDVTKTSVKLQAKGSSVFPSPPR